MIRVSRAQVRACFCTIPVSNNYRVFIINGTLFFLCNYIRQFMYSMALYSTPGCLLDILYEHYAVDCIARGSRRKFYPFCVQSLNDHVNIKDKFYKNLTEIGELHYKEDRTFILNHEPPLTIRYY